MGSRRQPNYDYLNPNRFKTKSGSTRRALAVSLPGHFALFPFIQKLWEDGRAITLPGYDEPGLLGIALVFNATEYQYPALAQILIQLAAGRYLSGQFGVLYIQISSTSPFFVEP